MILLIIYFLDTSNIVRHISQSAYKDINRIPIIKPRRRGR
jgi:hypothetical protein